MHHAADVPHHVHIMQPLGERFDKKYVVSTMKYPPNQMIWGAMSCRDAAGLYFIPPNTTLKGLKYVELLKCTSTAARSPFKMALLVTDQR